ncbi:Bor family protein [Dysgonomonas sp. ZJ279]|uniref:Bor family protein n=1 Tax=Dysgonomonas sp. ZJ279 TaxID=2709796 RepID=UPI0013EB8573|nr:Bor family protein [Dysgonomonas sp. ZJ279]
MKLKNIQLCLIAMACMLMTSCYTAKVANGNIGITEPTVKVNSKKNHFLLWGLVPLGETQVAKDYVGDRTDYTTENTWTFVDGLLNCVTFGIYSPTTTSYYVPLGDVKK